jgi:hypothetical protein
VNLVEVQTPPEASTETTQQPADAPASRIRRGLSPDARVALLQPRNDYQQLRDPQKRPRTPHRMLVPCRRERAE